MKGADITVGYIKQHLACNLLFYLKPLTDFFFFGNQVRLFFTPISIVFYSEGKFRGRWIIIL